MNRVYISIGSNIDREHNIRSAVLALRERFDNLELSPVYETQAVGFDGDPFFNLAAGFDSAYDIEDTVALLKAIESQHGRGAGQQGFRPRTLDLDLLLYGDLVTQWPGGEVPSDEILRYAFVLRPLVDIAGEQVHPQLGKTFRHLWQEGEFADRGLIPVPLGLD